MPPTYNALNFNPDCLCSVCNQSGPTLVEIATGLQLCSDDLVMVAQARASNGNARGNSSGRSKSRSKRSSETLTEKTIVESAAPPTAELWTDREPAVKA